MFWEAWGRSTQTPSSLFWHNATTALTGQVGSHDNVPSSGSKLIPNHSSSRPAGRWVTRFFKWYLISFEVYLTTEMILTQSMHVTHGLWRGRPGLWGHPSLLTIPVSNLFHQYQRFKWLMATELKIRTDLPRCRGRAKVGSKEEWHFWRVPPS